MRLFKQKKAILLLSDFVWFLVFIVGAGLIFVALYYPLYKTQGSKAETDFAQYSLNSDSQYVASVIPSLVTLSTKGQGGLGSATSQSIAELAIDLRNDPDPTKSSAYSQYGQILEYYFSNPQLWTAAVDRTGNVIQPTVKTQISVIIFVDGAVKHSSCFYAPQYRDKQVHTCAVNPLPGTKTTPEELFTTATKRTSDGHTVRYGFTFVPSRDGPITIAVYSLWLDKEQVRVVTP